LLCFLIVTTNAYVISWWSVPNFVKIGEELWMLELRTYSPMDKSSSPLIFLILGLK
jgi:hypothetical protein